MSRQQQAQELQKQWETDPRWKGIKRSYSAEDVVRLRGSIPIEHARQARRGKTGASSTTSRSSTHSAH